MVRLVTALWVLAPTLCMAQASDPAKDDKNLTLAQRYWVMKSKAETYMEYKVIKEYTMDGVWRITIDSLKEQRHLVAQGKESTSKLQAELQASQHTLAKEREKASQVIHDSTHISILGLEFNKGVFITLVSAIFGLLFFIGTGLITRMKLLQATAKEKIVIAEVILHEFEDFKQKAMDKQIKLARELQNERNKVADLKSGAGSY